MELVPRRLAGLDECAPQNADLNAILAHASAKLGRMLARVLEPEVMDTEEEAADYDAMDHAAVNAAFVRDLLAVSPDLSRTLDLGTGTALIAIELCVIAPEARVVALDLARHMLALGRRNVARAGVDAAIELSYRDAKQTGFADASFSAVISNSLVHHVPEPVVLFREMKRVLAPGGSIFVRDLLRPTDQAALDDLVAEHAAIPSGLAADARARHERQRALFAASLHAALSEEEVAAAASEAGFEDARVTKTSDRHFTLVVHT